MTFRSKLEHCWKENRSMVCVGLDPDRAKIPEHLSKDADVIYSFNKAIIDATADLVCAYKPQFAYYAGQNALGSLRKTLSYLRETYPDVPVILDVKRGDIGSTATMYAREAFDHYKADAVTVNPYMGGDTLKPFLDDAEKGVVVLCRTSNPGSVDFQDLRIQGDGRRLFEIVAEKAAKEWNYNNNVALVAGATFPEDLGCIRSIIGDIPLLVPGVGAQGGDVEAVLKHGLDSRGEGLVINSSRGILYAGRGTDFSTRAREATLLLRDQINSLR
ncbi:MAG: orotidine-5'-phosphate decarboxylase [Opitutales bacterium]|nr:orotidine-5'-phosphate decarboxylase [Opitutales bacterium]